MEEDHGVPEPRDGAGVSPDDPDQSGVSQDPTVVIIGDVEQIQEAEPAATAIVNDTLSGDKGDL